MVGQAGYPRSSHGSLAARRARIACRKEAPMSKKSTRRVVPVRRLKPYEVAFVRSVSRYLRTESPGATEDIVRVLGATIIGSIELRKLPGGAR